MKPNKYPKRVALPADEQFPFEAPVGDLIRYLEVLPEKYPNYFDFRLEEDGDWESTWWNLVASRWETDAEVARRLKRAKAKQ